MFALDLNSPIAITAISIFAVVIGALIGPLILDSVRSEREKRKLRHGLYRELLHWYENASWRIKRYDRAYSEIGFFRHPVPGRRADTARSIIQAEQDPQIGRGDLKNKIVTLRREFHDLEKELLSTNLYAQTLEDEKRMQYFYQLNDSLIISACYDNFRYAFEYQLSPYVKIPRGRFLTAEEAMELSLLEDKLDYLKVACESFEIHEKHAELDRNLLATMRRGRKRGTLVNTPETGRETSRWCPACKTYADPFVFPALIKPFVNDVCEHCGKRLLTVSQLSKNLESRNADEKRKEAARALCKTYEYNRTELTRANVDSLVAALDDNLSEVRERAARALEHIGKRVEKLEAEQGRSTNLNDQVAEALIRKLSDKTETPNVRKAAAEAIGRIYKSRKQGAGVSSEPLKLALQDPNDDVRGGAATAVGTIGDKDLFLSLETSLQGAKSESSQKAIVRAMGHFGNKCVPRLVQVLQDDKKPTSTRRVAASELSNVGDPSDLWEPLKRVEDDKTVDYRLRVSAGSALKLLQPQYEKI
jgi:HEAT repeat protein